jgi:hypothetical protein
MNIKCAFKSLVMNVNLMEALSKLNLNEALESRGLCYLLDA